MEQPLWETSTSRQSSPPKDPMDQGYEETYSFQSANPTTAEQELLDAMSRESRRMVKDCMEWEKRVLHSAALTLLTPEKIQEHYKVPSLPYPLLKLECQMLKEKLHSAQEMN